MEERGTSVAQSTEHLISAQVIIPGSQDRAPHWVLCWAWSLLKIFSLSPSISVSLSLSLAPPLLLSPCLFLKLKKKKERMKFEVQTVWKEPKSFTGFPWQIGVLSLCVTFCFQYGNPVFIKEIGTQGKLYAYFSACFSAYFLESDFDVGSYLKGKRWSSD